MKLLLLPTLLLLLTATATAQNGAFIIETSYAQQLNKPSYGYNVGFYYKTKWPVAARLALTQTYGWVSGFGTYYVQAGYMDTRNRLTYHVLVGVVPWKSPAIGVYTAGAGYRLTKAARREIYATGQLNLARNRLNNFFWMHLGFQFWFNGKRYVPAGK